MITTNMPKEIYLDTGNAKFYVLDRVRVATKYGSYIGEIVEIDSDAITMFTPLCKYDKSTTHRVSIEDIEKIRRAEPNETFETVPYYDAEEKEFWRTHWYTRDGIKEKTEEDIKMLEEFFAKYS